MAKVNYYTAEIVDARDLASDWGKWSSLGEYKTQEEAQEAIKRYAERFPGMVLEFRILPAVPAD